MTAAQEMGHSIHLNFDQETERSSPPGVAAQQFCDCVAMY
jgi:hypothetical protein